MDPRSCYVSCLSITLASSTPSFDVGQDVYKRLNELKDLKSNLDNLRDLAYSRLGHVTLPRDCTS